MGAGIAIGGGTGLLLGLIGGPLGLLFWGAVGALTGGAAGAGKSKGAGAFDPLVDEVKDAIPDDTSALILVAENPTAEQLVSAVGPQGRQDLTEDQVEQLKQAAVR